MLTDPAVAAFVLIPIALLAALLLATWIARRSSLLPVALIAVGWMALSWFAARSGVLRNWEANPPPFGILLVCVLALAITFSRSPTGRQISRTFPVWMLVAVQAFRLPLELAMHSMSERGIMPPEMTYTGRNWDIVTGATAIVVAALVASGRGGRALVQAWNVLGLALLVNVIAIAILSTPRFRYFGNEHLNTWVTYPPFVWLPSVMVLFALAGHLLIFRAISLGRRGEAG